MAIRVLIADDHGVVRQGLRMFLSLDTDIEIVGEAPNGIEALRLARELQPDVILMDLLMPEMDGLTFLERARAEPGLANIPAVVVTAKDLSGDERRRLERHATAVLRKGEDLERYFRETLRVALRRRAARRR